MNALKTVFYSNTPIDCYILKGRLEEEDIMSFVFDEHMVWVHPFRAVAIGGVKLKVPADSLENARNIIHSAGQGVLIDEKGSYELQAELENAMNRENEVLDIKTKLRRNPELLFDPEKLKLKKISKADLNYIIQTEKEYLELAQKKLKFTWKQFFYELFDFNRSVIKYLRRRPPEYYLSKELVEQFDNPKWSQKALTCPNCRSENVSFGFAIDRKWDLPYLILSFLIFAPFPPIRKNCHCYNCGFDFKNKTQTHEH